MVYLGNLLSGYADPQGARASYQLAVNSGHPEAARQAARHLADLGFLSRTGLDFTPS